MRSSGPSHLCVHGAKTHNLKNISVSLPRNRLVVITGPSGSGKSSLAFDTIFAEGQRRYVESLSAYARQFIAQMQPPEVEWITGLSPTIAIEQKTSTYNPRSTVGTVTEIHDYLRLLYAKIAQGRCLSCHSPIQAQSLEQMLETISGLPKGVKLSLLAPIVRERKGQYKKELVELRTRGFLRVRIDGTIYDLDGALPALAPLKKHFIDLVVDRFELPTNETARLRDSVELALKRGEGMLVLLIEAKSGTSERLLSRHLACPSCQVSYPNVEPRSFSFNSPLGACPTCNGLGNIETDSLEMPVCPDCRGKRLRPESLQYFIAGQSIVDLSENSIAEACEFFAALKLSPRGEHIVGRVVQEIIGRLEFLKRVGVSYLQLGRAAQSLSGGEAQRIRLATQIGSQLTNVVYVLDEPSIGLHPRDHAALIEALFQLRDAGNTVVVVEHDQETIERADHIVDMGPGAGVHGGEIVAEGDLQAILEAPDSLTGQYLRQEKSIAVPIRREATHWIEVEGVNRHNLRDVDLKIPLGLLTCVTGVSGSGKSTLITDTLYPLLAHHTYASHRAPAPFASQEVRAVRGLSRLDQVIDVDQSAIGRSPRSNLSTYTGLFSLLRDLYARLPDAQARGYGPGRFSFNVPGGRCEGCEGAGLKRIEMHFLPDVLVSCDLCRGRRYLPETLEVKYKERSIAEVLAMTVSEALPFFSAIPKARAMLQVLSDVGLGYLGFRPECDDSVRRRSSAFATESRTR